MTFVGRFVRIYREQRHPQKVLRRACADCLSTYPVWRRMPRWSAAQIAWHQARNARSVR